MTTHSLTSKGQVTIPVAVRRALHLKPGDRVEFERKGSDYVIKPAPSRLEDAFGLVKAKRGATLGQMDDGIRKAVAARYRRSK